jgi:hypothetical protein
LPSLKPSEHKRLIPIAREAPDLLLVGEEEPPAMEPMLLVHHQQAFSLRLILSRVDGLYPKAPSNEPQHKGDVVGREPVLALLLLFGPKSVSMSTWWLMSKCQYFMPRESQAF